MSKNLWKYRKEYDKRNLVMRIAGMDTKKECVFCKKEIDLKKASEDAVCYVPIGPSHWSCFVEWWKKNESERKRTDRQTN